MPRRSIGLLLGLLLAVVAAVSNASFSTLNGWFFDTAVKLRPGGLTSFEHVLVLASTKNVEPAKRAEITERLESLEARLIVWVSEADVSACEQAPPRDGIWRSGTAFSTQVAKKLDIPPPETEHWLDFRVPRTGLQVLKLERLLTKSLPRSMVEGKIVLIGDKQPTSPFITTSIHRGSDALTPLLFNALATDSMLRGGIVSSLSRPLQWSLTIALAIALAWLAFYHAPHRALWFGMGCMVLLFVGSTAALWWAQRWFPPVGPAILYGGLGLLACKSFATSRQISLKRTLLRLSVETQERVEKGSFLTSKNPWLLIEQLLQESFAHDSGILLLKTATGDELLPATPQSEARCHEKFGSRPPTVTLFQDDDAVITLKAAEPLGVWILPSSIAGDEQLRASAKQYADRLAAMLEQRELWQRQAFRHQLQVGGEDPVHEQLEVSIDLLDDDRLLLMEALDRSREAVLIYDGFARLIHTSRRSIDLLGTAGIDFAESTPSDLITQITDSSPEEARSALRYVMLRNEEATFMTSSEFVLGRRFLLRVRPMENPNGNTCHLPGLILLIQDITDASRRRLVKDEFVERLSYQWNNDFEAILAASALLSDPRLTADDRDELFSVITDKVKEAGQHMQSMREHLETESSPLVIERYPIRFENAFKAAAAMVAADLESHRVTLQSEISDYLQLVLASPESLEEVVFSILLTLIQDAREESTLSVVARQSEEKLHIQFTNRGYGMPQDRLDEYLNARSGGQEPLERIGSGQDTVKAWGGNLEVRSQVGDGMKFSLTLTNVV